MLTLSRTSNLLPFLILCRRNIFQENKTWDKWHPRLRQDLEQYWYPRLLEVDKRMNSVHEKHMSKCYVLSMFPYPSGRLHMGHLRVYTVTDVLSRWQRLRGKFVVQPMGWDAFGLPAENAAIERGLSPSGWTNDNIQSMKDQLMKMGLSLDWSRELATCDPLYYKWTQWIFLKLHEHGLTYQRRALVNWDPVDKTVLADELVDDQGRSWRSGAVVEKRKLRQWYFRTTAYSKSLLDGLKTIEGNQWRDVIQRQRGWIGRLSGTTVEFAVKDVESGTLLSDKLVVFTDVPHAISGVSFILVNSDNLLADYEQKDGSEVDKKLPFVAVHPLTGEELPIVLSHKLTFRNEESLDARLGIPFLNEEDAKMAEKFGFSRPQVLIDGRPFNIEDMDDSEIDEVNERMMEALRDKFCGGFPASPLRTDWLISRQRFWGTPIPIIHCKSCGVVPVPEEDLPVMLPSSSAYGDREVVPLAYHEDWRKAECPKCGATADRETDTMDTFVDSSWYFLRFLDSQNDEEIFDRKIIHEMMPVDIYVGGIEHAIRHLFYARFISHFLFDLGLLPQKEPFVQFLPVGLVMGKTYQAKKTGRYVNINNVTSTENGFVDSKTGDELVEFWDKMSKSKHNGTDPEDVISRLGVETTRLCMLANTGPHRRRKWEEDSVLHGVVNWQKRLWALVGEIVSVGEPLCSISGQDPLAEDDKFHNGRSRSLSKVIEGFEGTFVLSVTVAQLQKFTDLLKKVPMEKRLKSGIYTDALCDLVVCLSPLAPMFSCELWSGLQFALSIRGSTRYDLSQPVQMQRFKCSFDENVVSDHNATVFEKT